MPQFFVGLILTFPHAILHEASISFLGFGLPPEQPAIGIILSESMKYLSTGMWWSAVFPGLLLVAIVLLVDRLAGGYQIAGLYVLPPYRSGRTAAALLARTIEAAKAILPSDTQVWTSAIDRGGFSLCDKLLRQGRHAQKETEFYAVYQF